MLAKIVQAARHCCRCKAENSLENFQVTYSNNTVTHFIINNLLLIIHRTLKREFLIRIKSIMHPSKVAYLVYIYPLYV